MKEITHEEAVPAAQERFKYFDDDNANGRYVTDSQRHGFMQGAKWMQEQLKPEWMPVSERLPELGSKVFVYIPDSFLSKVRICYYNNFEGIGNSFTEKGVSHWSEIQLPPPPSQ